MPALSGASPNAVTLSVRSDNPAVASVPSTATIPAGGTTAVVPITGVGVGTTVVHVSALPDISEYAVTVNVLSSGAITLPSVSLQLGQSLPFPIALGAPSGGAGVVVTLTSSNPAIVKIAPTSVFIPAGQTMPATQPEVLGENIGAATITASAPDYLTTSQGDAGDCDDHDCTTIGEHSGGRHAVDLADAVVIGSVDWRSHHAGPGRGWICGRPDRAT